MASKGLELPQTRGNFQLKGKVLGVSKDTFYKSTKTKTNKDWRSVNFGVQVSKDSVLYVTFNGMPQDFVYYSGKPKGADKNTKNETVKVEWKNRNKFSKEGYRLIGINLGLVKTHDEKGKEVNDKRTLHPFDAAEYVKEHLEDGMSVFIRGQLEYSHYQNQNGDIVNSVKLIPQQISRCQDVDFDADDFEVTANFTQNLVFQSIEKDEEQEGRFVLIGNVVNYNSIETSEFYIENNKLASNFRKNLKPYTFIETYGDITTIRNTDEVDVDNEDDDGWGTGNKMKRTFAPYRTLRLITGADKDTVDTETYSEKKMDAALEELKKLADKEKEFETAGGSSNDDDWGSKSDDDEDDSDTPW